MQSLPFFKSAKLITRNLYSITHNSTSALSLLANFAYVSCCNTSSDNIAISKREKSISRYCQFDTNHINNKTTLFFRFQLIHEIKHSSHIQYVLLLIYHSIFFYTIHDLIIRSFRLINFSTWPWSSSPTWFSERSSVVSVCVKSGYVNMR
jgi:hypothetical protein